MTGTCVLKFFDEELWPFLRFMFARQVQATHLTGTGWTKLWAVRPKAMRTRARNWLSIASIDLQSGTLQALFQEFHSQTPETKKHWRKVIDKYATSEEIFATSGDYENAGAVSFAGLEGLTRSIINGYDDKNQWLDSKLELKSPKKGGRKTGVVDAIEMVLRRESGTSNPELTKPLKQLANLRNSTVHTDLQSDPDRSDACHRWNASQALVEMLLLAKMGLEKPPNRTEHGTLTIMGHDMYRDVRGETILPRRCQRCGEWTGTVIHRACRQVLCSPCCAHHDESGCTEAAYPPAH